MANTTRIRRFWITSLTLAGLGLATACTTDDSDPGAEETGGSSTGGSSTGGSSTGGSSTGGSSTGGTSGSTDTACASPVTIPSSSPGIATFDEYDGSADLKTWSFPLGGDVTRGVLAGTFVYGDNAPAPNDVPEAYDMVDGNDSTYALSISDTLAEDYGGGMGLWLSACLDARAFDGISFWVRGNGPNMGSATMTVLMEETTSATPATPTGKKGTCVGTDSGDAPTCIHPKATFAVTEDWTQVQLPWSAFTGGKAGTAGPAVPADGHNIWQIQYDIGLLWADDGTGTYVPTAAPYELVVDDLTFY